MKKKRDIKEIIGYIVLFSFIIPIVFLVFRIIEAPSSLEDGDEFQRVKSDYVLMLLQCLLGIFAMTLPSIISKRFKIIIPSNMYVMFIIFLYCAIFLGEIGNFYYKITNWDLILHTFSGGMLGALGFSIVNLLNKDENIQMKLSPIFVAFFSFCFAVTLGALWEIYEFVFDGTFGLNMQKFALEDGTQLIGRAALSNTMRDIIVDCIGALVISMIGYISLKYKKGWFEGLLIRFKKDKN